MKRPSTWGLAVVVVYGIFALSTLGFVAFAMTQPVDLVSPDYYQRSLAQDRRLEAMANAHVFGTEIGVEIDRSADALIVRLPTEDAEGTLTLYRPASAAADRHVPLTLQGGRQRVDVAGLARGRWLVQIEWTAGGRPYYHEAGVVVP